MTDLTDWAMGHAAIGYHVFPLRGGSKLPATKRGFHGSLHRFQALAPRVKPEGDTKQMASPRSD